MISATHMPRTCSPPGLRFKAVADLLGHEDAGLVARRHPHALPDEIASADEQLDAWLNAQQIEAPTRLLPGFEDWMGSAQPSGSGAVCAPDGAPREGGRSSE